MSSAHFQEAANQVRDVGCSVLRGFLEDKEVVDLRTECKEIVRQFNPEEHPVSRFSTYDEKHDQRDEYFMNSSDKIRYFFEEQAFDSKGKLTVSDVGLALNKIGHGLHILNPVFKRISFSSKMQELVRVIGFQDPAVVQSMYIFKQPYIGGEVTPHQDATFLNCDPIEHLVGFWFALEDATLQNGCLHFIPGSHKTVPLTRRFVRNKEPGPLMKMVGHQPNFEDAQFVPAPVKKGDLVLIHGLVVHRSSANNSAASRHAYTFHVIERHGTSWNPENWLQVPEEFPSLYAH